MTDAIDALDLLTHKVQWSDDAQRSGQPTSTMLSYAPGRLWLSPERWPRWVVSPLVPLGFAPWGPFGHVVAGQLLNLAVQASRQKVSASDLHLLP